MNVVMEEWTEQYKLTLQHTPKLPHTIKCKIQQKGYNQYHTLLSEALEDRCVEKVHKSEPKYNTDQYA